MLPQHTYAATARRRCHTTTHMRRPHAHVATLHAHVATLHAHVATPHAHVAISHKDAATTRTRLRATVSYARNAAS